MITLQKQKDKDFLILNFTDIHLRKKSWDNDRPKKIIALHIIKTLIERVKPDLITISGDISYPGHLDTYGGIADLFDSFGIPWAPVWGNHDNQDGFAPVSEAEKVLKSRKNCLYESGDPSLGHGNYLIGIEEEGQPLEALIMMDTHSYIERPDKDGNIQKINARLTDEQTSWYRRQISGLKAAGYKESSLFIHIPIYGYREAFYSALLKGLNPWEIKYEESFSPVFWNKGYEGSFGVMHDRITSHPEDDGVLKAILEEDHTKTVLCGHDHKNSFAVTHKGVRFAYALRSGSSDFDTRHKVGGTLIKIGSQGVKEIEQLPVDIAQLKNSR